MARKFYVATGLENAGTARAPIQKMSEMGWVCSYDWTAHGSVWGEPEGRLRRLEETAEKEMLGVVMGADLIIVLLPGGKGTHTELGAAIATTYFRPNVHILLVGEPADLIDARGFECTFYRHRFVEVVRPVDLLRRVEELYPSTPTAPEDLTG